MSKHQKPLPKDWHNIVMWSPNGDEKVAKGVESFKFEYVGTGWRYLVVNHRDGSEVRRPARDSVQVDWVNPQRRWAERREARVRESIRWLQVEADRRDGRAALKWLPFLLSAVAVALAVWAAIR